MDGWMDGWMDGMTHGRHWTHFTSSADFVSWAKKDSHLPIFIFSFLVTTHAILQLKPIQIQIDQYKKKLFQF
jgi:hypothetical protein